MGICSSCDAASPSSTTAKVILHDGRLQEYSHPVKVSYVLHNVDSNYFLCNSDEMEFDDVVSEVDADEDLQPGQVYFALPLSLLHRPLQPEEMAALAVKASSAMMKSTSGDKCRHRTDLVFSERKSVATGRKGRRNRSRSSNEFAAKLSAIPE